MTGCGQITRTNLRGDICSCSPIHMWTRAHPPTGSGSWQHTSLQSSLMQALPLLNATTPSFTCIPYSPCTQHTTCQNRHSLALRHWWPRQPATHEGKVPLGLALPSQVETCVSLECRAASPESPCSTANFSCQHTPFSHPVLLEAKVATVQDAPNKHTCGPWCNIVHIDWAQRPLHYLQLAGGAVMGCLLICAWLD